MGRLTTLKPRLATQPTRLQAQNRIRGRKLQEFRDWYLRQHPLCAKCSTDQRPVQATQLDHKVALVNGGKDFNEDPGQAQGLCDDCHKEKTAEDLGQKRRPEIGADGWPVCK